MESDALRDHLVRALDWEVAHVGFDTAVDGIPLTSTVPLAAGLEHSPWQLLEHMRIAQEDILDFCVNANYGHNMKWPDDYWPQPRAAKRSGVDRQYRVVHALTRGPETARS
jgi:hypothetical protein